MKMKLKNLLCLAISCIMLFGVSSTVYATESNSYSFTINEYDVYVATRATNNETLIKNGYSSQTIQAVKSNKIENELLRLSKLTEMELTNDYGYTPAQVDLIQNYDGGRIEEHVELRGVFADMNCSFEKVSASTIKLAVKVSWEWTNTPLLSGTSIVDIVGIRWQGTNNAGQPINLALNTSSSSCTLYHYFSYGTFHETRSAAVKSDDPYGHAYAKFNVSYLNPYPGNAVFAKKGVLQVTVDRTGTDSIKEAAFVFGYGHTIITMSPSLSLPASFGIGFSSGVETMCEEAIRMSNTGIITQY